MSIQRLFKIGFRRVAHWECGNEPNARIQIHETEAIPEQPPHALYAFCIGDEVMYIGKTRRGLRARLNGYISAPPGDRRTNGRIRDLIRNHILAHRDVQNVDILIFTPDPYLHWGEFVLNIPAGLEDTLIAELEPQWNGGHIDRDVTIDNPEQVEPPPVVPVEEPGNHNLTQRCRQYIVDRLIQSQQAGHQHIDIRSGDIHDELGLENHYPNCCDAMRAMFCPGDAILSLPRNRPINQHGQTFDEQRNDQPYRGACLQVRFLTGTPRNHLI